VLREKAAGDLGRIAAGTSKTRERLGVVEELFTYWALEDADAELEELEDALIVRAPPPPPPPPLRSHVTI
jgi:fused signal recognition particle receptor